MIKRAKAGAAEQWVGVMLKSTNGATKGTRAIIPTKAMYFLLRIITTPCNNLVVRILEDTTIDWTYNHIISWSSIP